MKQAKGRKKSLVGYANSVAFKGLCFVKKYPFYPEILCLPLIFSKPLALCKNKVRITIEEIPPNTKKVNKKLR